MQQHAIEHFIKQIESAEPPRHPDNPPEPGDDPPKPPEPPPKPIDDPPKRPEKPPKPIWAFNNPKLDETFVNLERPDRVST